MLLRPAVVTFYKSLHFYQTFSTLYQKSEEVFWNFGNGWHCTFEYILRSLNNHWDYKFDLDILTYEEINQIFKIGNQAFRINKI